MPPRSPRRVRSNPACVPHSNCPNLSDVSKQRVNGSQQIILDRDLQLVVNSLWACGAEAISVGGVRVGPK